MTKAPTLQTFRDLVFAVGWEYGIDLPYDKAEAILWNETGYPSFWDGDSVESCTTALRIYFESILADRGPDGYMVAVRTEKGWGVHWPDVYGGGAAVYRTFATEAEAEAWILGYQHGSRRRDWERPTHRGTHGSGGSK